MAIKYTNPPPSKLASNKPPEPSQSPDQSVFVQSVALQDGRTIWVTLPQPDKLSFTSYLLKGHFGSGGLDANVMALAEGLSGSQSALNEMGDAKVFPTGKKVVQLVLKLGPRGASVHLIITRHKLKEQIETAYLLRVECNPRKVGPSDPPPN